jgi:predicted Abi (CAAX) family protease
LQKWFKLLGLGLSVLLAAVLFPSVQAVLMPTVGLLLNTWQLVLSLLWIGLLAFIFAGLLSPLEALGWWAGWYGDAVKTIERPGFVERPVTSTQSIDRYIVYLDGIGQATYSYLPDVEAFLDQLEARLPETMLLLRGIMPYSVLNRPLTEDRLLSFFWRFADHMQVSGYGRLTGTLTSIFINLRNFLNVCVSADRRYGPIYNQGMAQVIYNSLIGYGYQPQSGVPLTLIGFSGGGQIAMGALPFLKQALDAAIEVISIAGVISGSVNVLQAEHLYHLVGDRDPLERLGPILFPKRWKVFPLSYWNRAKRQGKISVISLGAVGHSGAGSALDAKQRLSDGRTHLQQTLDLVTGIILDNSPIAQIAHERQPSNYETYRQAAFNRPDFYPLHQSVDPTLYRPIATWMGRLILPSVAQRRLVRGALFEVYHADPAYPHLVGQIVNLRWNQLPAVQAYLRTVTKDLHFNDDAEYSLRQGNIHPERINHWRRVDPLESLAGARSQDDIVVMLRDPVLTEERGDQSSPNATSPYALLINQEPVQISGRFYALVKILQPVVDLSASDRFPDRFRVVHFNRASGEFDGAEEIVCIPQVIVNQQGICPATTRDIEKMPPNAAGWYIYGAKNHQGQFVVQSIAPRALLRLQPDQVISGQTAAWNYLKRQAWQDTVAQKGNVSSVLLCPADSLPSCLEQWQPGDMALLLHTYGGIGGKRREPAAQTPIFFGHFAYGVGRVVHEPLADELMFEIEYHQVYTHNSDGIIAGTLAWNRFLGDRQFGWLGTRPVCDLLVKLDAFTEGYGSNGSNRSALDILVQQLERMTARYRIGDGTGGTYVGFAHNCAQDSNQALYAALKRIRLSVESNPDLLAVLSREPAQALRFAQLAELAADIRSTLLPFGAARADWQSNRDTLGISPEEDLVEGLLTGLKSWRTLLPRLACETIARLFLEKGATVWVLRTNQVGGYDPDIAPIAPTQIGW